MKRGFTLVELLAVIAILGVIALIAIPAVDKALNQGEERAFETQKAQIIKGAKDFFSMNPQCLPNDDEEVSCTDQVLCDADGVDCSTVFVTVGTLQKEGFLQTNLKNPKTNDVVLPSTQIKVEAVGDSYQYTVEENTMSGDNDSTNGPVIVLKGGNIQYVEINTPFVDNGYTATSQYGVDITNDVEISYTPSSINTNELGTYTIKYSVTNAGETAEIDRTVLVVDTTKPIITINVDGTYTIKAKDVPTKDFLEHALVSDNSGAVKSLNYTSNVSQIAGNYVVTYIAEDYSGNKTTKKLNVVVNEGIKFESREDNSDANIHYVDITFPEGEGYINQYSSNLGETFNTVDGLNASLDVEGSSMIIARIVDSDGNIVMSLSYTI